MSEFFPGKSSDFNRLVARRPSSAQREILSRYIQSAGQKLQKVSIGTVSLGWGGLALHCRNRRFGRWSLLAGRGQKAGALLLFHGS